mmetsp:Transcript_23735/g.40562  ORF Transcript_23735/g.40562 Transcript_23735/m.40562 type:complete len:96 (-) Transcript_23735:77-364(-)
MGMKEILLKRVKSKQMRDLFDSETISIGGVQMKHLTMEHRMFQWKSVDVALARLVTCSSKRVLLTLCIPIILLSFEVHVDIKTIPVLLISCVPMW